MNRFRPEHFGDFKAAPDLAIEAGRVAGKLLCPWVSAYAYASAMVGTTDLVRYEETARSFLLGWSRSRAKHEGIPLAVRVILEMPVTPEHLADYGQSEV